MRGRFVQVAIRRDASVKFSEDAAFTSRRRRRSRDDARGLVGRRPERLLSDQLMAEQTYKALSDVVTEGKAIKAGQTFTASDETVAQALAFGLVEPVKDEPKAKPRPRAKR